MVFIVVVTRGWNWVRWLCTTCIQAERASGADVEIKGELTTGFPCERCNPLNPHEGDPT